MNYKVSRLEKHATRDNLCNGIVCAIGCYAGQQGISSVPVQQRAQSPKVSHRQHSSQSRSCDRLALQGQTRLQRQKAHCLMLTFGFQACGSVGCSVPLRCPHLSPCSHPSEGMLGEESQPSQASLFSGEANSMELFSQSQGHSGQQPS